MVSDVAGALGAEVVVHAVKVGPGPNLEARARAARLGALPPGAATGHTADDQAETVLLNMLRGAATDGLAAMRAGARHPISGLRRAETHELCARLGVRPVEDVTNDDPAHLRNRVRHELLPALCELAGRDVVPILARQARLMADDASLLDELAAGLDPTDASARSPRRRSRSRARALREWLRCDHPPDLGDRRTSPRGRSRRDRRGRDRRRAERAPVTRVG